MKQKLELPLEGVLHPLTQAVTFWPAAKGAARRRARRARTTAMGVRRWLLAKASAAGGIGEREARLGGEVGASSLKVGCFAGC